MSTIDYQPHIPNNVSLDSDRRLQRALERWQPRFLDWWREVGPEGFQGADVYLRTATSTKRGGWANFGYVKMPDYRWGIFLQDQEEGRKVNFGEHAGRPAWQTVPGEHRAMLRRLIITQADTEPASVEQHRRLATIAPSLYDMRNLFQVNVEEGRHLWQMVYLLHAYFGRDGREEAEALLARRAGDDDQPRILDAFNQPCEDWLSFFCFTMFMDRDGKFQLGALAESGFDPLSRSCRFMLTEEAHHLFVGESGLERIVRRSAQLSRESKSGDASELGGIDLPVIQRYINYWFAYCLDLFGAEVSTNAADAFAAGLKGRWREAEKYEDHSLLESAWPMMVVQGDELVTELVPMRSALNEVLRGEYRDDCARVVERWNRALAEEGVDYQLSLPSTRFYRRQGLYAGHCFNTDGALMDADAWERRRSEWLPTEADRQAVMRVMGGVSEPGVVAQWIAAPRRGIHGQDTDFSYVRFD